MDFIKHMIPATFSILMVYAYNIETFTETTEIMNAVALLFILYGWCVISFSYVFGWLFKSYGNA